jgi:hypothetical protein
MDPNVVLNRLARLARFDTSVFDEVRDDPNETISAVVIAIASALLAGIGAWLWYAVVPTVSPQRVFVNTVIIGSVFTALMYGVAALVAYVVLVQIYKVPVDLFSLVRTLGYAAAPLALSVLMFVPIIFPLFSLMPIALLLVMMIYAVQSASDAEPGQVVVASVVGLGVMVLVLGLIATSASVTDAPMGAGQFGILFDLNG